MKSASLRRSFLLPSLIFFSVIASGQVQWQRHPSNPVIPAWSGTVGDTNIFKHTYAPSVLYDSGTGLYKAWFSSALRGGSTYDISYATSSDGITWTFFEDNPVLPVGPTGSFDSRWVIDPSVVYTGTQYRMYYTGYNGNRWETGLALSTDGIHWTKYSGNPILTVVPGTWESVVAAAPKVYYDGSTYIMMYSGFDGSYYNIGRATSTDGVSFSRHPANPVLRRGPPGTWDANSASANAIVHHDNQLYLFYNGGPFNPIGFATSADAGITWSKYHANPVFDVGSAGAWDGSRVTHGSLIVSDTQWRYWYTGYSSSRDSWQIGYATGISAPPVISSDTVALWHFNEHTGSLVTDSSPYGHHGTAFGTTIVGGVDSNGRFFNGFADYVLVPNSPFGAFNFGTNQSFTISAWFKTTQTSIGHILRRGLAPVPGYDLRVTDGRVQTEIGNREDGSQPDTLLRLTSTGLYNDGQWHHAIMVRDRERQKLYLYVDGVQATPPVNDPIPFALSNDRPLAIGRWENNLLPTFFHGAIDEVYIFRGARHPGSFTLPDIHVSPQAITFGRVLVGQTALRTLEIANVGGGDTLIVSGIILTDSVFSTSASALAIPPGTARNIDISYTPYMAQEDTGAILISSNDPDEPVVRVSLAGEGLALGSSPVINTIRDIPGDQGKQVRVIWYRSVYDGIDDSLHVTEYGLWRKVDVPYDLWDYLARIPAVEFEQYAYVAPTLRDSTAHGGIFWSVFRVSAHTATGPVFFSDPDSGYSVDNLPPQPPLNVIAVPGGTHVALTWNPTPDPDLDYYVVHRGTFSGFVPSSSTMIGTTPQNGMIDPNISGHTVLYYRVVAVDSSGNPSVPSEEASVFLVGVEHDEEIPNEFALYQNYPNPFNPVSVIRYDLPSPVHVSLKVYDILGREVAVLVNEWKEAGRHRISWDGSNSPSGVYLYRIQAGHFVQSEKMVLIK